MEEGAFIRGPADEKEICLVFTGHEFAEGGEFIRRTLRRHRIPASFFFTGDFYRNRKFHSLIRGLVADGHYLGPHSDRHLLYNDWSDRQKVLVDRETFQKDLWANYREMEPFGIRPARGRIFMPPFEWYNRTIVQWAEELGVRVINYTPGTISHTDYKSPADRGRYYSSAEIYAQILDYERKSPQGLRGFLLLTHIGAGPGRPDKFHLYLDRLVVELAARGYRFLSVDCWFGPGAAAAAARPASP